MDCNCGVGEGFVLGEAPVSGPTEGLRSDTGEVA